MKHDRKLWILETFKNEDKPEGLLKSKDGFEREVFVNVITKRYYTVWPLFIRYINGENLKATWKTWDHRTVIGLLEA